MMISSTLCTPFGDRPTRSWHILIHIEKARGCITTRTVTASTLLTDYDWPGLAQVYLSNFREKTKTGEISHHTQYCITSLAPERKDLLKLQRGHSTIENKGHWVRERLSVKTLHKREREVFHTLWQHYATLPCRSYVLTNIQKLKQCDFSLQKLNSVNLIL